MSRKIFALQQHHLIAFHDRTKIYAERSTNIWLRYWHVFVEGTRENMKSRLFYMVYVTSRAERKFLTVFMISKDAAYLLVFTNMWTMVSFSLCLNIDSYVIKELRDEIKVRSNRCN